MSICSDTRRRQRGDIMLEALVGVLITSVIGAGLAHVVGRVLSSQRDAKVENLVVEQLRSQLQGAGVGLCDGRTVTVSLPDGDKTVTVVCESASANVTVSGITHAVDAPQRIDLEVSASDLGVSGAALKLSSGQ